MSNDDQDKLFINMLHHRAASLVAGEPLMPPIAPASLYHLPGEPETQHQYGRWTNPTWSAVEEALGVLENAQCTLFPSGMAAICAAFMTNCRSGDRILLPDNGYAASRTLAETYLQPNGIIVEFCPQTDFASRDFSGFKLVFMESPTNPELDICDIADVACRARTAGALLIIDNTTSTCLGQRPLDFGADIVVSSDSKAMNGHSDVLMGHTATRSSDLAEKIKNWRILVGAIPGHFEAWLFYRGLKTFELRFERMCSSADIIAHRLSKHDAVSNIRYPGLASHPGHAIAKGQMTRFGSVIAMTFADKNTAERFINETQFIIPSTSFGGIHTSAERRARWGDNVPDSFVRLSVGCEPVEPLWQEMKRVLDTLTHNL